MELAEQLGPYETYEGSPASQGLLQVLYYTNTTKLTTMHVAQLQCTCRCVLNQRSESRLYAAISLLAKCVHALESRLTHYE
jgi:hypothetical protein